MLNLYPLPYSTLAPAVYHVYLHPEDFEAIEPVAPRRSFGTDSAGGG